MGQLLMILIVPPLVGIVTYAVLRLIWEARRRPFVGYFLAK
jgi:hypothetical protein